MPPTLIAAARRQLSDFRRLVAVLGCFAALTAAAHGQEETIVWRTPARGMQVSGLSGTQLTLPPGSDRAIRAWAGIAVVPDGGPAAAELGLRHFQQVAEQFAAWKRDLSGADAAIEINSRIRHAAPFRPLYFDVVVVQFPDNMELHWLIDTDLDGVLEARGPAGSPAAADTAAAPPGNWVRMSLTTKAGTTMLQDAGLPDLPEVSAAAEIASPLSVSTHPQTQQLYLDLLRLDRPAVRKQHLEEIAAVATDLIGQLEREHGADSDKLADPLYRKGRALAYRELPDVVARNPVRNPAQLDREFEDTFERLHGLVDVTRPDYVLLAIRRERRRGYRGAALDLLEIYRRTHPRPDWYRRKRSDLLRELKLDLRAHQAAADLWLHGARPAHPLPVVFRLPGDAEEMALNVSWTAKEPWRSGTLQLRRVSPSLMEGVAWLPVNSTHHVELTPSESHQFRTDETLLQSGSLVTLRSIGDSDQ